MDEPLASPAMGDVLIHGLETYICVPNRNGIRWFKNAAVTVWEPPVVCAVLTALWRMRNHD